MFALIYIYKIPVENNIIFLANSFQLQKLII